MEAIENVHRLAWAVNAATPLGTRTVDVSDTGIGTIQDNDAAAFQINDVAVNEEGGNVEGFTVSLTNLD